MHIPVLLAEVLSGLNLRPGMIIADCTMGGGGHSAAIAEKIGARGRIIAIDRDQRARQYAAGVLDRYPNIEFVRSNFSDLGKALAAKNIQALDGALFDLGVSSFQLDILERGFSWKTDCPLDMRMEAGGLTAAEIVNTYTEKELADLIYVYSGERYSRRIARNICAERRQNSLNSSAQLRKIIMRSASGGYSTRTASLARVFQALRIEVNQELAVIEQALTAAANYLKPDGRLAVISFHSLEDRLVKNTFRGLQKQNVLRIITKKPLTAGAAEIKNNPRARSAKLRLGAKYAG